MRIWLFIYSLINSLMGYQCLGFTAKLSGGSHVGFNGNEVVSITWKRMPATVLFCINDLNENVSFES